MNHSTASSQWISTGAYIGIYRTFMSSRPQTVTDAHGEPVRFRTPETAECAAWRALKAEEDRIVAIRFDPAQAVAKPKFWETIRSPKSRAGRKALFNSIFQQTKQGERA